jgi:hypothetical protein
LKNTNRILIGFLLVIISAGVIVYSGCSKSKCGGNTCQNGATCSGDKCVCPTGYSGTSCEAGWTDKLVGTYTCKRSGCSTSVADNSEWKSVITKSGTNGGYTVSISNFDNGNITETATIDSAGIMKITPATVGSGISANGKFVNGIITMPFAIYSAGGPISSCTLTMTKL